MGAGVKMYGDYDPPSQNRIVSTFYVINLEIL